MSGFELTGDEIGAGVSVIVVDAAPGEGPRLHRHRYREVFVVLEGEATFTHTGSSTRATNACVRSTSTSTRGSRLSGSSRLHEQRKRSNLPGTNLGSTS